MTSKLNVLTGQCRAAVSEVRPPQLAASLVDQFLSIAGMLLPSQRRNRRWRRRSRECPGLATRDRGPSLAKRANDTQLASSPRKVPHETQLKPLCASDETIFRLRL